MPEWRRKQGIDSHPVIIMYKAISYCFLYQLGFTLTTSLGFDAMGGLTNIIFELQVGNATGEIVELRGSLTDILNNVIDDNIINRLLNADKNLTPVSNNKISRLNQSGG